MVDNPITVVAFDPGGTTGHAVGIIEDGTMAVRAGQTRFDHIELYNQLAFLNPQYVIAEEFEFRNRSRKGLDLYPRELLGVLELWCQQNKKLIFRQKAGQALGAYYKDTKLKQDGLYIAGKPHAMDALRHLLHWYTYGFGYQFNIQGYGRFR